MKSYQDLLVKAISVGETHADRTGVGTRSLLGETWEHDMRHGFPAMTCKKVNPRLAFEELCWIISGSSREQDLAAAGVDYWKPWATAEKCAKFGREPGDLGPTYGPCWRNFGSEGYDQFALVLRDLETNPNSRRLLLNAWHPNSARAVELPPCHFGWQLKVNNHNELSMVVYCRSIDLFLGLPYDIMIYGFLLEAIAHATNRTAYQLKFLIGDAHIYTNHIEQAKTVIDREPMNLPSINFGPGFVQATPLQSLELMTWGLDVSIENYKSHPAVKAKVAV